MSTLKSEILIPELGFGTWQLTKSEAEFAVDSALNFGYRHIDCAHVYENESAVGIALTKHLDSGTICRENLFVTSKLWNTFHLPHLVTDGCQRSLWDLNLNYLDLYLIHWPVSYKPGNALHPLAENGDTLFDFTTIEETWMEMEKLVDKGLVKSIGLSNFNKQQIQRIFDCCTIKPSAIQIESHLDFLNEKLISLAKSYNMLVLAYSPLGSSNANPNVENLLSRPIVLDIAKKYNKTAAQILLRHAVQRGLVVIPRSSKPERIKENSLVFDFELTESDMAALNSTSRNVRRIIPSRMIKHPEFPFNAEV